MQLLQWRCIRRKFREKNANFCKCNSDVAAGMRVRAITTTSNQTQTLLGLGGIFIKKTKMASLSDIPDDLFLTILSDFSHKELCKSVAPVSRKWRDLAYDPTLWKEFNIAPSVSVESLKAILRRSPLLEQLSWESVRNREVPPILKSAGDWCGLCPQLKIFKMTNFKDLRWRYEGMKLEAIQTLLKTCQDLTHLAVPYSGSLDGFTKAVCDHRIIDRLGIHLIGRGNHEDLPFDKFIVQVSGQFLQLKSIEIGYWGTRIIPDAAINALVTKQGSSLEEFTAVSLRQNISIEGVNLLAKCKKLKTLCLRHDICLPTPAELKPGDTIFAAIKPMKLEHLNLLGWLDIWDDTEREYLRREISDMFINGNLSGLTTLRFDIGPEPIIDDGVLKILIECCPELAVLEIERNSITKVGVSAIVFGDNRLRKLRVLDMGDTLGLIGDYLLKIPKSLPKLRKLSLSARESDSQVVERLMENKELAKVLTVNFV